jgi:hypothetical protein
MLIENITHPLLNDFILRVTGSGDTYFNTESSSRLNNFVKYISSITRDSNDIFAFYPLRSAQNIGKGNYAFGIGDMASGAPVFFPEIAQWTESGINLGSDLVVGRRRFKTVGLIDFSGKVRTDDKFQFRRNETSVFYFLKHNRPKNETSLYRPGQTCPYYWFDDSVDNFGVIAPEFSTSDFRTVGTTYIYDEIYGGDKKGYQVDFSASQAEKYNVFTQNTGREVGTGIANYTPPPVSFYEIDNNENKFVCINTVYKKNNYSIRSFFGKDYRILTGRFPDPKYTIQARDTKTSGIYINNLFPQRMVIGAGVKNDSVAIYDLEGLDHLCAGVLILQGDYTHKAKDIAENMAEAIGIKVRPVQNLETNFAVGNIFSDNFSCSGYIKSINYYDYTTPVSYKTYSDYDDILKFSATIYSGSYIDYGRWTYTLVNSVTGELRSPERADILEPRGEVVSVGFNVGLQSIYPPVFGSYYNRGVVGFVSGIGQVDSFGNFSFSRFTEQNESGTSGFYLISSNGNISGQEFFPPKRRVFQEKVIGYVSGIQSSSNKFLPFNEFSELYSSGYFINNNVYKFPKIKLIPEPIIGYISGYRFDNGIFSGFDNNSLTGSSGYFYENMQYNFLPNKDIEAIGVTGFLIGIKSGDYFSGFYKNNPIDGLYSGIFIQNDFSNPAETEDIIELYFPTGSGEFSGFSGLYGFDENIGFKYTGFFSQLLDEDGDPILDENNDPIPITFDGNSGFVEISPGPFANTVIGSMTGLIGSKNIINFTGAFNGFENTEIANSNYGYEYSGFFVGYSGFSGAIIDPQTLTPNEYGIGIFTGFIGSVNNFQYINLTGFNDEPEFANGGLFSGFFVLSSGFSGINGAISGTGMQTGFIGSKYYFEESGIFSGFSGFAQFTTPFLNEINIDFNFTNGSGFSGVYNQSTGLGVISGLITTGKSPLLFGDPLHFVPTILAIQYGGNNIVFNSGDFIFTGVIPEITGITYLSGFKFAYAIQSGTFVTGDSLITGANPEIIGLTYFTNTGEDAILSGFDSASLDYILRLESYEGQKLESGVRIEIDKLISGLKTDNVWDKITDGCLMAGPRTHSGIFIPLKNNGKTGISYNFVSGDYSRLSGLLGDGSSKYIDTAHNLNQETTGSQHMAVYITRTGTSANQYYIGAGIQSITGSSAIYASGSNTLFQKSRASGIANYGNFVPTTGLMITSRFNTGVWVARNTYVSETAFVYIENGAQASNIYVFANNPTGDGAATPEGYSDARIAMYSIGINVDILKDYENRIIDYLSGIKNYIN